MSSITMRVDREFEKRVRELKERQEEAIRRNKGKKVNITMTRITRRIARDIEDIDSFLFGNKKGSIPSIFVALVMLLIVSIILILVSHVGNQLFSAIQDDATFAPVTNQTLKQGQPFIRGLDYILPSLFIGLTLFLLIGAWIVDSHPIFFYLMLPIYVGMMILSGILTKVFTSFNVAEITTTASEYFPLTAFLMSNLPIMLVVVIVLVSIVMYSKTRSGGI